MLHLAAWAMGGIDAPMSALTGPAVQWLRPTATDERPTVAKLGPTDSTGSTGTATQLATSARLLETNAKSVAGTAIQFATGTAVFLRLISQCISSFVSSFLPQSVSSFVSSTIAFENEIILSQFKQFEQFHWMCIPISSSDERLRWPAQRARRPADARKPAQRRAQRLKELWRQS